MSFESLLSRLERFDNRPPSVKLENKYIVNHYGVRVEEGMDMAVAVRVKRVGKDRDGLEYAIVRVGGDHDGGKDYTFGLNQIVEAVPMDQSF
jgi:hypothetical protein